MKTIITENKNSWRHFFITVILLLICSFAVASAEEEEGESQLLEITDVFAAQDAVDEALQQEAENGYDFEDPLIVLDPYGNSPLTAVMIFSTDQELGGTITVKGKSEENDVVGTFEPAYDHIVQVYGLYNADTTEVEVELEDGTSGTYEIACEGVDASAWNIDANMIDDTGFNYSNLTIVCTTSGKLIAVDAAGDIRWYFSYGGVMGVHQLANGHLMGPSVYTLRNYYHKSGLIEFDLSGKVYTEYAIPGGMHHDFQELSNGNLLVASSSPDLESLEDYVVEIDRETGEVVWELDMRDLFEDLQDGMSASMLTDGSEEADWFHNNAVWYDEDEDLVLLSARHKDAIIAVRKSDQTIAWILGDPEGWETMDESLFFTPVGDDFEWFYAQHQVSQLDNGDILLFDNGAGKVKYDNNENRVTGDDVYSRAVVYHLDTDAMTVEQVFEYGEERGPEWYSDWMSGVISLDGTDNALQIDAGTNLYLPEEDSYDYGVSDQFTPGIISTTHVDYVLDKKLAFELTISGDTFDSQSFRAFSLPLYTQGASLDVTKSGVLLGELAKSQTTKPETDFTFEEAEELPEGWTFTLDPIKLTLSGSFTTQDLPEDVPDGYLVLKSSEDTNFYELSQTAMENDGVTTVSVSGWISANGLENSIWDVYLILDDVVYDSGYYLQMDMEELGYYRQVIPVEADPNDLTDFTENDGAADAIETDIEKEASLVETSLEIDAMVEEELNSGNYDFENPLIILNPYRISPLTGYILFQTDEECAVRVTVKGKTKEADITGEVSEMTTDHRIPMVGLYAGEENTVEVELLDESGDVTDHGEWQVETENLPDFFDDIIEPVTTSGSSAFPLTMVYGQGCKYPFAFDCNGDIRWYFSKEVGEYGLYNLSNDRLIMQATDTYATSYGKPQYSDLLEIDYLGRAFQLYYLPNGSHHEVIEKEEGGNLLCLTSSFEGHFEDEIVEIDRETGEILNELPLDEIFGETYVDKLDWAHVNTVSYQPEDGTILISCRNLHSVMKIDWESHELVWILSNPQFWEGTEFEPYVLQPTDEFNWHYQQHSAYQLDEDLDGNPDTIEISIFDNHTRNYRHVSFFDGLESSFLTVYSVNEKDGTVSQIKNLEVASASITSNTIYDPKSGHIFGMCGILNSPDDGRNGMIYEFDYETEELLNQFSIKRKFYRATEMKMDYNDMAAPMQVRENYLVGSLRSVVDVTEDEIIEETPVPLPEDGPSFKLVGNVLYVGALDHSFSQVIFEGQDHTYVYDITDIPEYYEKYLEFWGNVPISLDGFEPDSYEIYCVYEDQYCQTGETFTISK